MAAIDYTDRAGMLKKALVGECPKCGAMVERVALSEPPPPGNIRYTNWGCGVCRFELVYSSDDEAQARK